jgi:DNA-binding Lrp family transcriptional regulator
MAIEDAERLIRNCREYARIGKSIDVLRNADGKRHYKEIAKIVGIHSTKASSLLKRAEKLGLAKKINKGYRGYYKKLPGILGYMPKKSKLGSEAPKKVTDLLKNIARNKIVSPPSVPISLPIPPRILGNLNKMRTAYIALYCVENSLRELIRQVFLRENGWWINRVPPGIQEKVVGAINEAPYYAARRNDELEYTHLGQLKEIIICNKNWKDFMPHLNEKDKNAFSVTINKAIPSRNAIGHCIPLQSYDLRVVKVRFEDIIKMIK